jgi:F0F1-type ATP synthase assembly protein I
MKSEGWIEIIRYSSLITGIGLTLTAAIWLGWQLGAGLEQVFGGFAWLIVGLLVGIGGGFISVYSMLKKFLP